MGQRHLILVKLPYEVDLAITEGDKNTVKSSIVPIYNGWLYGRGPVQNLIQFIQYVKRDRQNEYPMFNKGSAAHSSRVISCIKMLCSLDFQGGSYNDVLVEGADIAQNPSLEDNNDGVTVIDISEKKIKYCFFFFHGGDRATLMPMSAEAYMRYYYNDAYYESREPEYKEAVEKEIAKLINQTSKLELISFEELSDMFPDMFIED